MTWRVQLHSDFALEFAALEQAVKEELAAVANLLTDYGPQLGRPHADTLKGSKYKNMKELRFEAANGEWRAAFAFDPQRKAILLVAGDKAGGSQKRFYKQLIAKADQRFTEHLEMLKTLGKGR